MRRSAAASTSRSGAPGAPATSPSAAAATARGVGIGSSRAAVRAAFPKARFDRSTEELFGVTLVRIPKGGGGRMQMTVDVQTDEVTAIGIPYIAFCE